MADGDPSHPCPKPVTVTGTCLARGAIVCYNGAGSRLRVQEALLAARPAPQRVRRGVNRGRGWSAAAPSCG
jgi:hypothetical protein